MKLLVLLQAVKVYADTLELQIDVNVKESNGELIQDTQLKFIPLDRQQQINNIISLTLVPLFKRSSKFPKTTGSITSTIPIENLQWIF